MMLRTRFRKFLLTFLQGINHAFHNSALAIRIVALTSVGTIYCNSFTKLKESETVENAKQLYNQLSVTNAQVSYSKDSGTVTIK